MCFREAVAIARARVAPDVAGIAHLLLVTPEVQAEPPILEAARHLLTDSTAEQMGVSVAATCASRPRDDLEKSPRAVIT